MLEMFDSVIQVGKVFFHDTLSVTKIYFWEQETDCFIDGFIHTAGFYSSGIMTQTLYLPHDPGALVVLWLRQCSGRRFRGV